MSAETPGTVASRLKREAEPHLPSPGPQRLEESQGIIMGIGGQKVAMILTVLESQRETTCCSFLRGTRVLCGH